MGRYPDRVTLYEVGPRDGLQNEAASVSADVKVDFVERLAAAGLPAVEVTSFVSPRAIPQLADGGEVFRKVRKRKNVRYPVLVPNLKGYEAARAAGALEIAVFTAASDSFNRKNIGCGIDESIERFRPVLQAASEEKVRVRGYVSTAFHCPYQGRIEPGTVASVTRRLFEMGIAEVSIGDTIGGAVPTEVHRLLDVFDHLDLPFERLALHFHDTRGTALANVLAGLEHGICVFDSSAGGLGGCPYAPGASGNLSTEDLLYMLSGMDISTGVDLERVREASRFIGEHLPGRVLPSRVLVSGALHPMGPVAPSVE